MIYILTLTYFITCKNSSENSSASLSAAYFCRHYLTNESVGSNSVDPDQTAAGSTLFDQEASKIS